MARRIEAGSQKVPKFRNEEEAAQFWDNHSPLDYPEHFQEAAVTFSRPLIKKGLTVKLSEQTIDELKVVAQTKAGQRQLSKVDASERIDKEIADL